MVAMNTLFLSLIALLAARVFAAPVPIVVPTSTVEVQPHVDARAPSEYVEKPYVGIIGSTVTNGQGIGTISEGPGTQLGSADKRTSGDDEATELHLRAVIVPDTNSGEGISPVWSPGAGSIVAADRRSELPTREALNVGIIPLIGGHGQPTGESTPGSDPDAGSIDGGSISPNNRT